jgi:hypothetical protein
MTDYFICFPIQCSLILTFDAVWCEMCSTIELTLEAEVFILVRNNVTKFSSLYYFKYVLVEYFIGIVPDIFSR